MSKFMNWLKTLFRRISMTLIGRYYQIRTPNLSALLDLADPSKDLSERIRWTEQLLVWVRTPVLPGKELRSPQAIQSVRVRFLLQSLERNPLWKVKVGEVLFSVLVDTDPLNLFCLIGLPREGGFFSEVVDRVARRILPVHRNPKDLSELFVNMFGAERDAIWLMQLEPEVLNDLFEAIAPSLERKAQLQAHFDIALQDALAILSAQIESLGLSPEIRMRTGINSVRESAFWSLRLQMARLQTELDGGGIINKMAIPRHAEELLQQVRQCEAQVETALRYLENHGVSVAIVYRLEQIESFLQRVSILIQLRFRPNPTTSDRLWLILLAELILNSIQSARLLPLIQANIHLLARKIVERTGDSGEQYITRSKAEYFQMLASAIGGGALTSFTALGKFVVSKVHAPPVIEGFLVWINYSGSFLAMQMMHLSLATKQTSMTAPALAAKLKSINNPIELQGFVREVADMTRSQFIAAVGNVGAVIPCAVLLDFALFKYFGRHALTPEYAEKVVATLNPLTSLTIFYAALTGVLLWVSSVCAGWLENWFVYRQLPVAISQSPMMRTFFGHRWSTKIANWIMGKISGIGGNVSLGFFLAYVPVVGQFFGVGLEVRHVTLAAGSLAFAIAGMSTELTSPLNVGLAVLGVGFIGVLNFGVSFALALWVAIRARNIKRAWVVQLLRAIWLEMRQRPKYFLFPQSAVETKS